MATTTMETLNLINSILRLIDSGGFLEERLSGKSV
jgi:hypothetical protein